MGWHWESRVFWRYSLLVWWPMSRPAFKRLRKSWLLQLGPFGVRKFAE